MDIQLISVVVTVGAAVLGLLVAFGRMALGQFERRIGAGFEDLQKSIGAERDQMQALKRQLEQISQTLPIEYVRREDWIRFSSVIDTKLDRLGDGVTQVRSDVMRLYSQRGG